MFWEGMVRHFVTFDTECLPDHGSGMITIGII